MAEEFNAFLENHTSDLVARTSTVNVISCKQIYKTKFDSNGSSKLHKACLYLLEIINMYLLTITKPLGQLSSPLLCIIFYLLLYLATGLFIA